MPDQLADFGLKLNYWYITNRQQLKKWWVLSLLALDIFLLAAVLTNGVLLAFRFRDVSNVVASIATQTKAVGTMQLAPTALQFGSVVVTPHGLGRYDLSVRVENTNATWSAAIVETFTAGSKTLSPVRLTIPPKSVRYAMALDVEGSNGGAPSTNVQTTSTSWTRLTLDQAKPVDLTVTDLVTTTKTLVSGTQQERVVTQATGTVVNRTFSTIRGLRVAVVLVNGSQTVGVRSAILSTVGPEQSVPFSVEWDTVISDAQNVQAYPEISRDQLSS